MGYCSPKYTNRSVGGRSHLHKDDCKIEFLFQIERMGYNFQLPQSPHVVTIKKKLSIPVPVQLEVGSRDDRYTNY